MIFCSLQYLMEPLWTWLKETYLSTPTSYTVAAYLAYYAYICLASIFLPAKSVLGHPQPKRGPQLAYSICGFRLTILTILIMFLFGGIFPSLKGVQLFQLSALVSNFWPLWSTVNLVAIAVAAFLYLKGKFGIRVWGQEVDRHSHGSLGLDFWVGRELNPRIGSFDIKFIAYRVAMIFWLVLNFSFLALQAERHGQITIRMWLYQAFTGIYVLDYFCNEEKMLTTWDIISEEFGYMLVFGDYVFIPFAFSVQCHYLLDYPDYESILSIAPVVLLYLVGYYLFRNSNSQKNQFKLNPKQLIWGKEPQTIGGKLLVSGFWGLSRHMNYTGDLIMALAYCLPCGAQLGGYFYAYYLLTLLLHRAYRDDAKCREKYSKLWKEYTDRVPYVFLPLNILDAPLRAAGKALYWLTNGSEALKQE